MERVLLKLSGQALSKNGTGLDGKKLHDISLEIKALKESGYQIGIVCGAGNFFRGRTSSEYSMNRSVADNIGMLGTVMNALALQDSLEQVGLKSCVLSAISMPQIALTYSKPVCDEYFSKDYIIIFAGGTGNPYFSTDTCAALRASQIGAKKILMAKNGVDGVYDSDPAKNKNAKRYTILSYDEMIDKSLQVIDLSASLLCKENNLETIVFDMNKKDNIVKIMKDSSLGTIINVKGE